MALVRLRLGDGGARVGGPIVAKDVWRTVHFSSGVARLRMLSGF